MLISRLFLSEDSPILTEEDYEDSPEHQELKERLRKTLYYGRNPKTDRPSLPVTEIAVELLQDAAPRELGRVDAFVASSLSHKASVSPCALMIGLIYIERLKHRNPEYLQQISSSDLFLISMMVASKYLYDEGVEEEVFNDEWSEAANMETPDLNQLERDFLSAVDWNLFVKETDFRKVLNNIERRVAVRKGRERGFYSYCDLMVLTENDQLRLLIQEITLQLSKVVLVCSVAYAASILTLLGASVSLGYVQHHTSSIPRLLSSSPLVDLASINSQFDLDVSVQSVHDAVKLIDHQNAEGTFGNGVTGIEVAQGANFTDKITENVDLEELEMKNLNHRDYFGHFVSSMNSNSEERSTEKGNDNVNFDGQISEVSEAGVDMKDLNEVSLGCQDLKGQIDGSKNSPCERRAKRKFRRSRIQKNVKEQEEKLPRAVRPTPKIELGNILPHVSFPEFLTLSVIRDTLVQFLFAIRDHGNFKSTNENSDTRQKSTSNDDFVCSCGCCEATVHHPRCQNTTFENGGHADDLNSLNSLNSRLRLDPDSWNAGSWNSDINSCHGQQCCCPTANLGEWSLFSTDVNDPLIEIRKGFQTMRLIDAVS